MVDIYDFIKELTKFDIEFKDDKGNLLSLKSYIKSVDEDRILIDIPSYKGRTYNIPDGQSVNILICSEEGVFLGESNVIGKEISTIPGLWISFPLNNYNIQRREYLRVPLNIDMTMIIYEDRSKVIKKEFTIITNDLSAKGFSYFSSEPLKNYYDIECSFNLDDGIDEPITSKCDHIYSTHQITAGRKIRYINGFAFVDVEEKFIDRIIKKSFKYQLELRKKGLI
ncbi:MAG: flagellar brake domain-containing protein [Candidatus Gastranaerophilales bacterium]|nr:flagellar brake domain-containing protein [Candidatus Gastranaerophilales bacterium]